MTSTPTGRWLSFKGLLALLSLFLAVSLWVLSLTASLDRDSVAPVLSLQQQERALLVEPAVPDHLSDLLQGWLVGDDPAGQLRDALRAVPLDRLDDRQRLLLASLTDDPAERQEALAQPPQNFELDALQQALVQYQQGASLSEANAAVLDNPQLDPLLRSRVCDALGGTALQCHDPRAAAVAAVALRRLLLAAVLPMAALGLGVLLLLRQVWLRLRGRVRSWPPLVGPLLTPVDVTLLVAGGFVLLGQVTPVLLQPLISWIARAQPNALGQAFAVLLGYIALASPPLIILKVQLQQLGDDDVPGGGWLQWRPTPLFPALVQGAKGWLMATPPVALTAWLMGLLFGDQGGSNPLLEIVLRSDSVPALLLLSLTAVVLAPLFEELVFRGVLLPVLARWLGRGWGVVLSGLVFAVAHLSIGELPPLLVLGIGLALLRLSSGRLLPCVVMHACWNAATFVNLILLAS
ncbi:MAG: CPBP family intramembrane glutamic endopeptidase [Synechococcus sp.]